MRCFRFEVHISRQMRAIRATPWHAIAASCKSEDGSFFRFPRSVQFWTYPSMHAFCATYTESTWAFAHCNQFCHGYDYFGFWSVLFRKQRKLFTADRIRWGPFSHPLIFLPSSNLQHLIVIRCQRFTLSSTSRFSVSERLSATQKRITNLHSKIKIHFLIFFCSVFSLCYYLFCVYFCTYTIYKYGTILDAE